MYSLVFLCFILESTHLGVTDLQSWSEHKILVLNIGRKDFYLFIFGSFLSVKVYVCLVVDDEDVSCPFSKSLHGQMLKQADVTQIKRTKQRRVSATRCRMKAGWGGLQSFSTRGKRLLRWVCSYLSSTVLNTGRQEWEEKIGLGIQLPDWLHLQRDINIERVPLLSSANFKDASPN